jgi:hypothetical protein
LGRRRSHGIEIQAVYVVVLGGARKKCPSRRIPLIVPCTRCASYTPIAARGKTDNLASLIAKQMKRIINTRRRTRCCADYLCEFFSSDLRLSLRGVHRSAGGELHRLADARWAPPFPQQETSERSPQILMRSWAPILSHALVFGALVSAMLVPGTLLGVAGRRPGRPRGDISCDQIDREH